MATKRKVNPTCSAAGRTTVKSKSSRSRSKSASILASRVCCKKKGKGKKCVNKGK